LQNLLAHLFDPAGDSIPMLRPERVENFQDHQIQRSLEDFRFLRLCVLFFGHAREDTLLPLACPQENDKMLSVIHALAHLGGFVVFVALSLELAIISR
jgi:hypothetical protein